MGILKGAIGFRRYRVEGDLPSNFRENFVENANRFTFRGFSDLTEEEATGWVTVKDLLAETIGFNDLFSYHGYALLSLRKDTKKVPENILAAYTNREIVKLLKSGGLQKVSKLKRNELKESLKLKLIEKIFPRTVQYDMCWNLDKGIVRFFNTSDGLNDGFLKLFRQTFMTEPLNLNPRYYLAINNIKVSDNLADKIGFEFLTWLFFIADKKPHYLKENINPEFELWFDDQMILQREEQEVSFKSRQVNESQEAFIALNDGYLIVKARIFLRKGDKEWSFMLSGETMDITGVKLPDLALEKKINEDEDNSQDSSELQEMTQEAKFFNKIYNIEELEEGVDKLFELFLNIRKSEETWSEENKEISSWLTNELKK